LHKMLVAQLRGAMREKQGKDVAQAAVLVAVLAEDAPDTLEEAYGGLPRRARLVAREGARRVLGRLEAAGDEQGADVLRVALGVRAGRR